MKIRYKLKEIYKNIFLVTISDPYDLAMTFCRAQEFYESPFKQFRGKTFTLSEFQRAYSKKFGEGVFTYPRDWAGFNVPGRVMEKFMSLTFEDWGNPYDHTVEDIHYDIKEKNDGEYYVIGAEPNSKETINHEICHALYYLDNQYRERVNSIISELNSSIFKQFRTHLLNIGYSKPVIIDEINAYICIDLHQLTYDIKMNKKEKKNLDLVQTKLKALFTSTISLRAHLSNKL
jgi:hypothetical protein